MIRFTKSKSFTGNVTVDAKNTQSLLFGTGTYFKTNTANLDLIILNSDVPTRMQVKQVANVKNNQVIILESNTKYFGDGTINISNGSNTIIFSQNSNIINLIAGDIIVYEYLNNIVESKIHNVVSLKTYTLNTVNSTFTNSADSIEYVVYPKFANIKYEIIRTYYNETDAANPDIISLSGTFGSPNYSTYTDPPGSASVAWKFTPAGIITYLVDGNEIEFDRWCDPSTPVYEYWLRAVLYSGDTPAGGSALDTWFKISGDGSIDPQFQWDSGTAINGIIEVSISSDPSGSEILATGYYGGTITFS
jgi:hypothetical protein